MGTADHNATAMKIKPDPDAGIESEPVHNGELDTGLHDQLTADTGDASPPQDGVFSDSVCNLPEDSPGPSKSGSYSRASTSQDTDSQGHMMFNSPVFKTESDDLSTDQLHAGPTEHDAVLQHLKPEPEYEEEEEEEEEEQPVVYKKYKCDKCNYSTNRKNHFRSHAAVHSHVKPYKCDQCDYRTARPEGLTNHKRRHSDHKPYHCDICGFTSKHYNSLKLHEKLHNPARPYKCDMCNFTTKHRNSLDSHKMTHSESKPFLCTICDFATKHQVSLRLHMRFHGNIRPYKCEQCDFQTTCKSNLTQHIRVHSNEKPYQCKECNALFKSSNALKNHKMGHLGLKPFSCPTCDRSFRQRENLKRHLVSHTGEKNFKCKLCDVWFSLPCNMRRHVRMIHKNKGLRYPCEDCDKTFSNKGNLKRHVNTVHKGERNFSCQICFKAYSSKSNLVGHLHQHDIGILDEQGEPLDVKLEADNDNEVDLPVIGSQSKPDKLKQKGTRTKKKSSKNKKDTAQRKPRSKSKKQKKQVQEPVTELCVEDEPVLHSDSEAPVSYVVQQMTGDAIGVVIKQEVGEQERASYVQLDSNQNDIPMLNIKQEVCDDGYNAASMSTASEMSLNEENPPIDSCCIKQEYTTMEVLPDDVVGRDASHESTPT